MHHDDLSQDVFAWRGSTTGYEGLVLGIAARLFGQLAPCRKSYAAFALQVSVVV